MLSTIEYSVDFCVVGGGLAGMMAAIAAARGGAKVALMHERPVLGGNASGEIRMWVSGANGKNVRETGILEEISLESIKTNPYKLYPIWDTILWESVTREPNITLILNCSCMDAEMDGNKIKSVTGYQQTTQKFIKVYAKNFSDCSGDSILAPLTHANFRVGRESKNEFGEIVSTEVADKKTMGMSCLIQGHKGSVPVTFTPPTCARKLQREDFKYPPGMDGSGENFWYMELGGEVDSIADTETCRDELISIAYGVWDYIKNSGTVKEAELWQLDFVGFLPGKRESRRMMGKYIMRQSDVTTDNDFPDTVAYGGWPIDDHDPRGFRYTGHGFPVPRVISPYPIPYRSLYSENIENLFFAGRNISMTHSAMSSVRVMATCALCGQAVGSAAALCAKYDANPNDIYEKHIGELQEILLWDDVMLPKHPRKPSALTMSAKLTGDEALRDGCDRDNVAEFAFGTPVGYTFDKPVFVKEARIIFDSNLDRDTLPGDHIDKGKTTLSLRFPTTPKLHMPTTLAKSYKVEAILADGTVEVLKDDSENAKRFVLIPVGKEVKEIKLTVYENYWGREDAPHFNKARVFSFEVR